MNLYEFSYSFYAQYETKQIIALLFSFSFLSLPRKKTHEVRNIRKKMIFDMRWMVCNEISVRINKQTDASNE